ncbi:MAG: DegV family protein [Solobacterium sp.]|nr:DegV family protein [Solobacterium sp.]
MSDYIIATSSTADLPKEYLEEHHIPVISYTFTLDGQVYIDDCTEDTKRLLFKAMREGKMPNTSQISEYAYYEFFKNLLEQGKDIIFTDMSRAISNSIVNAESAIEEVCREFPERRIHFIDSYCITAGLNLLVRQLVNRKEAGATFEEVAAWGEEHKLEFIHRFMVDDLQWLRRGGRLSNASAIVGSLLSIKPLLYVCNDGKLIAFNKIRGRKRCLHELILSCKDDLADCYTGDDITIIEADDYEDAVKFRQDLQDTYPQLKDVDIPIMTLGPVIAAHVGPGFIAVAYHGKKRIL